MTPKLKIIPLGGLGEIGKNMTVVEFGSDIVIIDAGVGFPDESMYGVDCVLQDITYLKSNRNKIRGLILTHGHEDHIGGVPRLLSEIDIPIYTTELTAALVELKLEENDQLTNTQIFTKKVGSIFRLGCFSIEFIHVNHSIPDAIALAIKTPIGTIVHTGDFKFDLTPIAGDPIDLARFGEYGDEGVLALLSDSTNVEKPGYSDSERKVGKTFDLLFANCDKRIIVTTFASNIHRLQQIINEAAKHGRKVAVSGRSMENILTVCKEIGYMDFPDGVVVDLNEIKNYPREKTVIISTGSQGESMSALYRMAFGEHKKISIDAGDRVIISASAIPGNENMITRVIDELYRRGAEVIYDKHTDLHVSGHAPSEELKMMLSLVRPKYFIPVHGEYRMLVKHANLGRTMGINPNNCVVADLGDVIEISKKGIKIVDKVQAGAVLVDGSGYSSIGSVVLHDRQKLAEDGMIVVVIPFSTYDKSIVTEPEIVTRGFIYVKEAEDMMTEMKNAAASAVLDADENVLKDMNALKLAVKSAVSGCVYKETKRSPMVLPVIIEL